MARALLLAALFALHTWRDRGICKRAARVAAADDRVFSPAVVGFVVAEHRRQLFTHRTGFRCNPCAAGFAGQRACLSSLDQTHEYNQLADGPQRRSFFKV